MHDTMYVLLDLSIKELYHNEHSNDNSLCLYTLFHVYAPKYLHSSKLFNLMLILCEKALDSNTAF